MKTNSKNSKVTNAVLVIFFHQLQKYFLPTCIAMLSSCYF